MSGRLSARCGECGNVLVKDWHSNYRSMKPPRLFDNCGRRVGKRVKVDEAEIIRLAKMKGENNG